MAGKWTALNNQPTFTADTMLLLTDGSVMCHELSSPNWHRFAPDALGNYVNGTWSLLAPLPSNSRIPAALGGPTNAPLYFASAVLQDGTVFVAGGEYNSNIPNADLVAAQIYDPVINTWTNITPPASFGWTNIGDAPCCVLPNGTLLLGNINSTATAIYDPVSKTWSASGSNGAKNDRSSEETWTLLPDQTVLTAECANHPKAEKYVPSLDKWVGAGSTVKDLVEAGSIEIGPAILLPDGRVFAIGATGATGLYAPPSNPTQPGSWVDGPTLPNVNGQQQIAKDAPACLLPNGRVLFTAGPASQYCNNPQQQGYCSPTSFFEFDPATSTVNAVPNPPNNGNAPYTGRLLLLPSGQVLFSNNSQAIEVYTPDGKPQDSWRPQITSCPSVLQIAQTYVLQGKLINGLSQAVS